MIDTRELSITVDLAQLELTDAEIGRFGRAVGEMLEFFETMNGLSVESLEPTTHALLLANRTRMDEEKQDPDTADALVANSPEREDRFLLIPNLL